MKKANALRFIGWTLVPYIMILNYWRNLIKSSRIAIVIWTVFVLFTIIGQMENQGESPRANAAVKQEQSKKEDDSQKSDQVVKTFNFTYEDFKSKYKAESSKYGLGLDHFDNEKEENQSNGIIVKTATISNAVALAADIDANSHKLKEVGFVATKDKDGVLDPSISEVILYYITSLDPALSDVDQGKLMQEMGIFATVKNCTI